MKTKLLTLFVVMLVAVRASAATHLKVEPLDGLERAEAISQIGYIKYTSDRLYIYSHTDELLHSAAFADTRKLMFGEVKDIPTSMENASASTIHVYPNPTQDALCLDNTQDETIKIVTLQGQVVETFHAQGGTTVIPVANLQAGTYLLLINSEIVKFIKQ